VLAAKKAGVVRVHCTGNLETKTLSAAGVPPAVSSNTFLHAIMILIRFSDEDSGVVVKAAYALSEIAKWVAGAQAIVDAEALTHAWVFVRSLRPDIRKWTCELVGRLAKHESTAPAILELKPCQRLVFLMR